MYSCATTHGENICIEEDEAITQKKRSLKQGSKGREKRKMKIRKRGT